MKLLQAAVITLLLFIHVQCKPTKPDLEDIYGDMVPDGEIQNDDIDPENINNADYIDTPDEVVESEEKNAPTNDDDEEEPEIVSKSKSLTVEEGTTVTLPCKIKDLGNYVHMWFKNADAVMQSGILIPQDPRLVLTNDSLIIQNVTAQDSATYKCMVLISATYTPSVSHQLEVQQEPKITSLRSKTGSTQLRVGDTLELICEAEGNPDPKISWYLGQKKGEKIGVGKTLTVFNVTHKNGGWYRCMADNGLKNPAMDYILIDVYHKPIITIQKTVTNSDSGLDAILTCGVMSTPKSKVHWEKNGQEIRDTDRISLSNSANDYTLTIRNLIDSDFGTYGCSAKNEFGSIVKHTKLVKTPAITEFIKPSKDVKDAVVSWRVESKQPVLDHELHYRRQDESDWHLVKPELIEETDGLYTIKHTFKDLKAGRYETKARSKNNHGWSDFSDTLEFEGDVFAVATERHPHSVPEQQPQNTDVVVGASGNGANSIFSSTLMLVSISLVSYLWSFRQ